MRLRNTTDRWGGIAQAFHWTVAVLVFGMMTLGWVMVYWPQGPIQFALFGWHKSFGMTVLLLAVLRLAWRLLNPTPAPPVAGAAWERRLAHAVHLLLYFCLFAMLLSGYVINSATNFPLAPFGWFTIPNLVPESESIKEIAEWVHATVFWILATLVSLHVLGALRHQLVLRDGVLRRMLPGNDA